MEVQQQQKIRIFNSNIKSVLFYGAETWRTTNSTTNKVQTFINGCMRKILNIHWPDKITNEHLRTRTKQTPARDEIGQKRWRWIGHTFREPMSNTTRQALTWNQQGKVGLETPGRGTSRQMGYTWSQREKKASDRVLWRSFVDGLFPKRGVKA